jgi:hypothetical protein
MNSVLWLRVVGTFLLGIMSTVSAMKNVSYVFVGLPQEMQKKEKKDLSAYPKKNVLTGLHADKFKGKLFDIAVDLFKELTDAEGLPERPYETTQLTLEELDILAAFLQGVYSKLTLHGGFPGVSPVVSAGFGDKKIKDILNRLGDFSDKVVDKDSASFGALDADDAAVVFVLTSVYLVSVHKSDENIVGGFAELNALSPSFAKKALAHFKERFKEKPETLAELNKVVFGPIDKQLSGAIRSIGDVKSAQMWVDVFNKNKGSLTEIQKEDLAKSFLDAVVVFIFAGYGDELETWKTKKPDDTSVDASAGFKEIRALEKSCRNDVYALAPKKAQDDFDTVFGEGKRALYEFQRDFFIAQFEKALGEGDLPVAQARLANIKQYVDDSEKHIKRYMADDAYKKLEEKLRVAKGSAGEGKKAGGLDDALEKFSWSMAQLAEAAGKHA